MNFLRSFKGFSKIDEVKNSLIREEVKIDNVTEKIVKHRENWQSHVMRKNAKRIPR